MLIFQISSQSLLIALVSPLSASYSIYIPELHVSISNNLPPLSSFTAKCYAIIETTLLIFNLPPNKFLIASDALLCFQSITSNLSNSHLFLLVFQIKTIIFNLSNYTIQFLWLSNHSGIHGNEIVDCLVKFSSNRICSIFTQILSTEFILILYFWSTY